MTKKRIVISPEPAPALEVAPLPLQDARRWRSIHEGQKPHGWPGIFVTQEAIGQINRHANSDTTREVGGMLVGQARRTPEGKFYVVVEGQLPARHVRHGPVHLTFTSDTLVDALDRLEETQPDRQIIGWYHTHPGMSVFLSSMDVWLHSHFFPQPWHVALVIEPFANQAGFFRYAEGQRSALHPWRYVGFYELVARGAESVAGWTNLSRDESEISGASVDRLERAEESET